jgi:hypothetical protein
MITNKLDLIYMFGLKNFRKCNDISQTYLADILRVGQSFVSIVCLSSAKTSIRLQQWTMSMILRK